MSMRANKLCPMCRSEILNYTESDETNKIKEILNKLDIIYIDRENNKEIHIDIQDLKNYWNFIYTLS
jgi:hypothetical protein